MTTIEEIWALEVRIMLTYIEQCENPADFLRHKGAALIRLGNAIEGMSRAEAREMIASGAAYASEQVAKAAKAESN